MAPETPRLERAPSVTPFPAFEDTTGPATPGETVSSPAPVPEAHDYANVVSPTGIPDGERRNRPRGTSTSSAISLRLRSASQKFEESALPYGMWHATGSLASSIPTLKDIRRSSYDSFMSQTTDGAQTPVGERPLTKRNPSSRSSMGSLRRHSASAPKTPGREYPLAAESGFPSINEDETHHHTSHHHTHRHSHPHPHPLPQPPHLQSIPSDQAMAVPLDGKIHAGASSEHDSDRTVDPADEHAGDPAWRTEPFDNGYRFPPRKTWWQATVVGCKALWRYFCTPLGFCVVIYFLNIVAWGGMLFLLLCNAAPAMCHPSCDDDYSARKIWLEITEQILCGLFCVTGFGLIPWRFRDWWFLMKYRFKGDELALRRLAGIHRGWFRLEGSQDLPPDIGPDNIEMRAATVPESAVPYPLKKIPDAPLTGERASPSAVWKLDFVIWNFVWNTIFQAILCGFEWGYNRFERPAWGTGFFVSIGCVVAMAAGILIFVEGNRIKAVEGVPVSEEDMEKLNRDLENGVVVYNTFKGKPPKEKKSRKQKKAEKKEEKLREKAQV